MTTAPDSTRNRLAGLARNGAVAMIAGVWRSRSIHEVHASVSRRPIAQQVAITLGVYGVLFALALIAAQFGWIGMALFFLAVIVVVG